MPARLVFSFLAMRLTESSAAVMFGATIGEETMGELPPLGRIRPIRVPVGKEEEYGENTQGDPVHLVYGEDEDIPGTVVPSASPATVSSDGRQSTGGGSPGFRVDDLDVPQNIISYGDSGHQVVARVTRADLMTKGTGPAEQHDPRHQVTAAEIAQRSTKAETVFCEATDAAKLAPSPSAGTRNVWGHIPTIEEAMPWQRRRRSRRRSKARSE